MTVSSPWLRRVVVVVGIVLCLVLIGCPATGEDPTFHLLTLTVVGDGTVIINGSIYDESGSPARISADPGTTLVMTISTPAGWDFAGWSGSDAADVTGSAPDYAILVDSDKSLTATFSAL